MRALVTGGTGYVGKPFVRRLLADGWEVALITRNREHAAQLGAVTAYEGDLADPAALARVAERERAVDVVFHLGASLSYYGDEKELSRANVEGTRNVLALAERLGAKKFIYASSIEAVGTVAEVPAPADVECRPVSSYGRSKVRAEALVREAARKHFPAVILRIGNVYASDQFSFLVEIAEAIQTRNRLWEFLPVYAHHRLQPAHIDDVVEGILAAWRSEVRGSETVTLAGEHASIGEMFDITAGVLGRRMFPREAARGDELFLQVRRRYHQYRRQMDLITYLMAGTGPRVHRAYDLEHTFRTIGFRPRMSIAQGIEEFLGWCIEKGHLQRAA